MPDDCEILQKKLSKALRDEARAFTTMQVNRHLCHAHHNEISCVNMDDHEWDYRQALNESEKILDDMKDKGCGV